MIVIREEEGGKTEGNSEKGNRTKFENESSESESDRTDNSKKYEAGASYVSNWGRRRSCQ